MWPGHRRRHLKTAQILLIADTVTPCQQTHIGIIGSAETVAVAGCGERLWRTGARYLLDLYARSPRSQSEAEPFETPTALDRYCAAAHSQLRWATGRSCSNALTARSMDKSGGLVASCTCVLGPSYRSIIAGQRLRLNKPDSRPAAAESRRHRGNREKTPHRRAGSAQSSQNANQMPRAVERTAVAGAAQIFCRSYSQALAEQARLDADHVPVFQVVSRQPDTTSERLNGYNYRTGRY